MVNLRFFGASSDSLSSSVTLSAYRELIGSSMERCSYLHKGDMVTISGDLALTEYSDRNGQPRCSLEVDVSDVAFPPAPKAPPTVQAPADSDELPI